MPFYWLVIAPTTQTLKKRKIKLISAPQKTFKTLPKENFTLFGERWLPKRRKGKIVPTLSPINLSQFASADEKPVYIGQNIYIKPSYIVSIPEFYFKNKTRSAAQVFNEQNLRNNKTEGLLSNKGISRLRNSINWLLVAAKPKRVFSKKHNSNFQFKVNFLTLTLPDNGTEIDNITLQKKLLNPFLVYLRKYFGLKNYVWKLEFQGNGKLHVHIVCDTFIHWRDLRTTWNRLLINNGFMAQFELTFGHQNPNSTDVHSIKKIKNLAGYLCEYMCKQAADLEKIKGRIWGCNYELSRANKTRVHIPATECAQELTQLMQKEISWKPLMRNNPLNNELKKWGEMFFISANNWQRHIKGEIKETFELTRQSINSLARNFTIREIYTV